MKKFISLENARKLSRNYPIHLLFKCDVFICPRFGKYEPDIFFLVPTEWVVGADEKPIHPLSFQWNKVKKEYFEKMNLDVNGKVDCIYFGDFNDSTGVFGLTDAKESNHIFLRVAWGYHETRKGRLEEDMKSILGEKLVRFHKTSSYAGGSGYDYYIIKQDVTEENNLLPLLIAIDYYQRGLEEAYEYMLLKRDEAEDGRKESKEWISSHLDEMNELFMQVNYPTIGLGDDSEVIYIYSYPPQEERITNDILSKLQEYLSKAKATKNEYYYVFNAFISFTPIVERLMGYINYENPHFILHYKKINEPGLEGSREFKVNADGLDEYVHWLLDRLREVEEWRERIASNQRLLFEKTKEFDPKWKNDIK